VHGISLLIFSDQLIYPVAAGWRSGNLIGLEFTERP